MKIRNVLYAGALVIATAAITTTVVSQDKGQPPRQPTPQELEMHKKWDAFATPGENHKPLNFKVGKWNGVVKMWHDPAQPQPDQSTCSSEYKWIMDGRYLSDDTEGSFEDQTFLGHGITGYDNLKKKFVWAWIDNMGTGIMNAEGSYDPATKTFKYTFDHPDVMAGKYVKGRSTERIIDNDHFVSEMYAPGPDGKEFKMLELTFTRAR